MSRGSAAAIAMAAVVILAGTALSGTVPSKYIDDPDIDEWDASQITGYRAWMRDVTARNPFVDKVMLEPDGGSASRVSAPGTDARLGELDLAGFFGNALAFSQGANLGNGNWDIRIIDLDSGTDEVLPAGINTQKGENHANLSGNHLLFHRGPNGSEFGRRVILFDLLTATPIELAQAPTGGSVSADDVTGDYATYTACPPTGRCDVYRYQISSAETLQMPDGGKATYYSSVRADGTVYFVRGSPRYCGVHTQIRRYDGTSTSLYQFPNDIEIGPIYAVDDGGGGTTVLFTRIRCQPFRTGIWQIPG